jgi:hypothetical protein
MYSKLNYNITNPNSICGKIEQERGSMLNNILLEILDCSTDDDCWEIINKISRQDGGLATGKGFFYIYQFCKLLYK